MAFPKTFIAIKKRSMFYIPDPLLNEESEVAQFFWRLMGLAMTAIGICALYFLLK